LGRKKNVSFADIFISDAQHRLNTRLNAVMPINSERGIEAAPRETK